MPKTRMKEIKINLFYTADPEGSMEGVIKPAASPMFGTMFGSKN
jgi:hypothetical protein